MSTNRHRADRGRQVRTLSWEYPAGHRVPTHVHDWHQLIYATAGVMTVHTPDGAWVVPTHRAVWVPARIEHSIEMSGAVSMRTLYFSPRTKRLLGDTCQVVSVSPLLRELVLHVSSLGGLARHAPAQGRLMDVLIDQLHGVPVAALHLPQPKEPKARKVAALLLEQPDDPRPLSALAHIAAASPRTIERSFKADTGMTFGRWRQQLRLVHALRLLASGQLVTTVALEVGYNSLSAFVHAFRKTFGTTPSRAFQS